MRWKKNTIIHPIYIKPTEAFVERAPPRQQVSVEIAAPTMAEIQLSKRCTVVSLFSRLLVHPACRVVVSVSY